MLTVLMFAALVAQGSDAATPVSGWVAVAPAPGESRHLVRHVAGGRDETLTIKRQICDCGAAHLIDELAASLHDLPDVFVRRSTLVACAVPAQHLIVTGLADATARRNIDLYAFRTGDSLEIISYFFDKPQPTHDDEAAMLAFCPARG